jgi:ribosome-binding factor A
MSRVSQPPCSLVAEFSLDSFRGPLATPRKEQRRLLSTGEKTERPVPIHNEALAQIKALGMPHLEATTEEVATKAREPLFLQEHEMGPTPQQLNEANRIYSVVTDALDNFSRRDSTFSIRGEPIVIMEVEVSRDLKQARVYWTLPFSVMELPDKILDEVTRRMQDILEKEGGKLRRLVHARLSSYYPPKLRFFPSQDVVFRLAMKDMIQKR